MRLRCRHFVPLTAVLLAGCAGLTAPKFVPLSAETRMAAAAESYHAAIANGKTAEAVISRLGRPQSGGATWEARYDDENLDSLSIEFGSDGRIVNLTTQHTRAVAGPPRSETGAETETGPSNTTVIPPKIEARMSAAMTAYAAVTKGMPVDAIIAQLGPPKNETAVWEARYNAENYDSLSIEFGEDGQITKSEVEHTRRTEPASAPE